MSTEAASSFTVSITCADCGVAHPPLVGKLGALIDNMTVARIRVAAPHGWSFNEVIALCPTCSENNGRFYQPEKAGITNA